MFHYLQGRQARLCGKANANIINIAHLCWVHWKESGGRCSRTPGDTHSSAATSPSPLLGDRGCEARSGTSGCRLPRRLSRVKLTGTRPEKFLISPLAVLVTVTLGQQEESAKVLGRGGHERIIKGPVLEVTLSPCLRVPTPLTATAREPGGAGEARARRTHPAPGAPPTTRGLPPIQLSAPPSYVCAGAALPGREEPREGARRAGPGARATPATSLGPGSPPVSPAEAAAGAGVEGVVAPGGGVLSAPGRARCPRASPLECTGESPLCRAGPLQKRFAAALDVGSPGPLKVKVASATSAAAQILQEPLRLC